MKSAGRLLDQPRLRARAEGIDEHPHDEVGDEAENRRAEEMAGRLEELAEEEVERGDPQQKLDDRRAASSKHSGESRTPASPPAFVDRLQGALFRADVASAAFRLAAAATVAAATVVAAATAAVVTATAAVAAAATTVATTAAAVASATAAAVARASAAVAAATAATGPARTIFRRVHTQRASAEL